MQCISKESKKAFNKLSVIPLADKTDYCVYTQLPLSPNGLLIMILAEICKTYLENVTISLRVWEKLVRKDL